MYVFLSISLILISNVHCISDKFTYKNFWYLFDYDIDGVIYKSDTDQETKVGSIFFEDDTLKENERFLIRKNLVPYSIISASSSDMVVSIPRTRPGIPSTLNLMNIWNYQHENDSPVLTPYPSTREAKNIISVYDMERDGCRRIWMVDTGLIDIPGARRQVQEPTVLIVSTSGKVIFQKVKIGADMLKDGVTSGLRTIALDYIYPCSETFMYINDDHSNAVIVFSLKDLSFRRIERSDTRTKAWTFPVPRTIKNYMRHVVRDRQYPNATFSKYSNYLAKSIADTEKLRSDVTLTGRYTNPRGTLYERNADHNVLLFTNEERTRLYCWNVDTLMKRKNIELLTDISADNDSYIADLDTAGNSFHIMVNSYRDPKKNIYDEKQINFKYYATYLFDALENTKCDVKTKCFDFLEKWRNDNAGYSIGEFKYIPKFITDGFKDDWNRDIEAVWAQF